MKTLVIDAIVGIGFPTMQLGLQCERAGLATFKDLNGRGGEPSWSWARDQLEKVDEEKLQELYTALREAREEGSVAESENDKPLIQLN